MQCLRTLLFTTACVLAPMVVSAQPAAPDPDRSDPDVRVDALQPDFNLVALPTTLRMPAHKWAFRVTHRFTRPLGQGDLGDLVSDFFGFDSAAQIGLELRYGLASGTQLGVHRTSDRTTQIFGQHNFLSERKGNAAGLDLIATLEGRNNLKEQYQSALGLALSKDLAHRLAVYAEPLLVLNTNPSANAGSDNNTLMIGLGTRVRVRPSMYLTAEITPRLSGFDPGAEQVSFGLEGRAGGHLFQLNISNGFGTTYGQLAANGAFNNDNWFIGFNIARKFF
jgi:Membrane bound beta barrel domain (DUF5777)